MDERERRLAENERLFREVNEGIEQAALRQGQDKHVYDFLCECSNLDCGLALKLTLETYERARSTPTVFIVALGHELPEIEEVIERGPNFELVRKRGEAGEVAREEDPRGR
jgi:hypothetical protein